MSKSAAMVRVDLPFPPSMNNLFATRSNKSRGSSSRNVALREKRFAARAA